MTQSALGHEIVHTPKTLETVEAVRAVCADILEGSPYSLTVEPHDLGGATIRLNASWYGNRAEWKAIWGLRDPRGMSASDYQAVRAAAQAHANASGAGSRAWACLVGRPMALIAV